MRPITALFLGLMLLTSHAARAADETMQFMQVFNEELNAYKNKTKIGAQEVSVLAKFTYCVVKKAGLKQTMAFYQDIKSVESQAHMMCKNKQETAAKDYVITEYSKRRQDPVVLATLDCYDQHGAALAGIIHNPKKAAMLPDYARWAHNPGLARTEMDAQQLCH